MLKKNTKTKNNPPKEAPKNGIGAIIREQRKRLGYTQEFVAEKMGISEKHYSRIESDKYYPSLPTFFSLIKVLELNLEAFSEESKNKRKIEKDILHLLENASDEDLEKSLAILRLIID